MSDVNTRRMDASETTALVDVFVTPCDGGDLCWTMRTPQGVDIACGTEARGELLEEWAQRLANTAEAAGILGARITVHWQLKEDPPCPALDS